MKVLIVGSGGREYSIGLSLKNDNSVEKIYFAPGNGATGLLGENLMFNSLEELAKIAQRKQIDLTIVGPEAPLVDGIVDLFRSNNLLIFGPTKRASQLEGSKSFMKNFLKKYNIPTARFVDTDCIDVAEKFIDCLNTPIVVKADGLCGGKGVVIANSREEAKKEARDMLLGQSFGEAGRRVVIEEFLDGYELSVFAICDGKRGIILPAAQDHKRLLDKNLGPNTGGMGAYAPTPLATESIYRDIKDFVLQPTLDGMTAEGIPFEGVLFIGVMVVNGKVYVLEYNVRFGDPECEVLMPLIKTKPSQLFYQAANFSLNENEIEFENKYSVGVVVATKDYPFSSSKSEKIIIDYKTLNDLKSKGHICFAGVSTDGVDLFTSGGRVLVCVGVGESIQEAQKNAYKICNCVDFNGKQYRKDIAYQVLV